RVTGKLVVTMLGNYQIVGERRRGAPVTLLVRRQVVQPLPIVESVLTCPHCGFASVEMTPTDACVVVHDCVGCHAQLRPKHGHCCVFCSYGSVKCPPMQQAIGCCGGSV